MSAASSGVSNANSDYSGSRDNSPAGLDNIRELAEYLDELKKIHEDVRAELEGFYSSKELFTHPDELEPTELANKEYNPAEKPQNNGATTSLLNQPSLPYSPPIYAQEAPDLPPPHPHVDTSATNRLVSEGDLPGVCLTDSDDTLFGIYQDLAHQNTGIHLNGGINEYGKWQVRWKITCLFVHPTLRHTVYPGWEKVFFNSWGRARWNTRLELERRFCDHFSDSYFATHPTRNWRQKYLRVN